ncbi:hypothetical protein L7F22_057029 [Adiantum nelumboides]|nr:hypothetical protein [Adiantum nelumboides]
MQVRHHPRLAHGHLWPARDQPGRDPRRRRHAAPDKGPRQVALDGAHPHRRPLSATEAASHGLVSRVVDEGTSVVDEAVKVADKIAQKGAVATQAAKEAVNASFELNLQEGNRFERRLFQALFATKDQKEGMSAFAEKRKVSFFFFLDAFAIVLEHSG